MLNRIYSLGLIIIISVVLSISLSLSMAWPRLWAASSANGNVTDDPLRFVDASTQAPLSNAPMRILCYTTNPTTEAPVADLLLSTDATGHLVEQLPSDCNFVAALHIRHQQPAGKTDPSGPPNRDAYWVYDTSWQPGTRQLHPAAGDIVIDSAWRLILFDVVASLEWEPSANSDYIAQLEAGLLSASAYLYDVTEGQMAIGPLLIEGGGRNWSSADLRFRAANDYRPTAQVGGIVAEAISYTTSSGKQPVYTPGEIWLGRYWDGLDGTDPVAGAWTTEAGYRTLIHEWMHYALFLYDEYQDSDGDDRVETYCTCVDLPALPQSGQNPRPEICGGISPESAASIMAYHYTTSELWLSGLEDSCQVTDQYLVHNETDWETLARWSEIQGLTTSWLQAPTQTVVGPDLGLAQDLFGRRPTVATTIVDHLNYLPLIVNGQSATPRSIQRLTSESLNSIAASTELTVNLVVSGILSPLERNGLYPQLYTLEPSSGTAPARIVHQGTTTDMRNSGFGLGQAPLLGIQPGGNIRAFVDFYNVGGRPRGRLVYASDGSSPLMNDQTLELFPDEWRASLDINPGLAGPFLNILTMTLTSLDPLPITPTIQLCVPDADIGCPTLPNWRKPLVPTSDTKWQAIFTATSGSELPHYAIVHVEAPGVGELMRWTQTPGGVGPAHIDHHAPLRDGMVMVDATEPITGVNGRVVIMPAANYDAVMAPLPLGLGGTLGTPLDIDIHLPNRLQSPEADRVLDTPIILTLFHGNESLSQLGVDQSQLQLLHFSRSQGQWQIVPTSGRSEALNWVATVPIKEDGIYAIGWNNPNPQKIAQPDVVTPGEPIHYTILMPGHPELDGVTETSIIDPLASFLQFTGELNCTLGECFYDEGQHAIVWQGPLGPEEWVQLDFVVEVDPEFVPSECIPPFRNEAQAFDGVMEYLLGATTVVECVVAE